MNIQPELPIHGKSYHPLPWMAEKHEFETYIIDHAGAHVCHTLDEETAIRICHAVNSMDKIKALTDLIEAAKSTLGEITPAKKEKVCEAVGVTDPVDYVLKAYELKPGATMTIHKGDTFTIKCDLQDGPNTLLSVYRTRIVNEGDVTSSCVRQIEEKLFAFNPSASNTDTMVVGVIYLSSFYLNKPETFVATRDMDVTLDNINDFFKNLVHINYPAMSTSIWSTSPKSGSATEPLKAVDMPTHLGSAQVVLT